MRPTLALLALTPILLFACIDDSPRTIASAAAPSNMSSAGVAYSGTTLTVDGRAYERMRGVRECGEHVCVPTAQQGETTIAKGALIVGLRTGSVTEARARLARLGLTVTREFGSINAVLIAVPPLFEAQWLDALSKEKFFEYVEYDGIVSTTTVPLRPRLPQ